MTQYGITVEDGQHRVYATDNGIDKRMVGPRWASPRQAMRYANLQAELDHSLSPLRRRVEGSIPDSAGVWGTASGDEAGALDGSPAVDPLPPEATAASG